MNRPSGIFEIQSPTFDISRDLHQQVSDVWATKHADAIRFHDERGMSRAALIRIYGFYAVARVLG